MKKSLLLLALISFALIFITPQVNASDRDVGLSYVLPADNATSVAIDCQACIINQEYVVQRLHQDPGDMCKQHFGYAQCWLRADVDLTELQSDFRDRHGTRLMLNINRCNPNRHIISTSNGGAGY